MRDGLKEELEEGGLAGLEADEDDEGDGGQDDGDDAEAHHSLLYRLSERLVAL